MLTKIDQYLEKLEKLIDIQQVMTARKIQEDSWCYRPVERLPLLINTGDYLRHLVSETEEWPVFNPLEQFNDQDKMLVSELATVFTGVCLGDDKMYTIRANYGLGIIPSLFGCNLLFRGDDLPWVEHINSVENINQIIDSGVPDLEKGLGSKVTQTEKYFIRKLRSYSKLREVVHLYMSDTQSPFNIASLILGERVYIDVYDNPELIHRLLHLITDTIIQFTRLHKQIIGEDLAGGYHFQYRLQGGVRLCEDSSTLLSKNMYEEFCRPYNERIFDVFGGGYIHYCGAGKQILDSVLATKGIQAINFGNSEMQDIKQIYEKAAPKKICVLWDGCIDEEYHSLIKTGVVLKRTAEDMKEARQIMRQRQ